MDILLVSPDSALQIGGIERACESIARTLSRDPSLRVTWAANASTLSSVPGGVRILPLATYAGYLTKRLRGWPSLAKPSAIRSLLALRRAVRASDVVHAHDPAYVSCVAALLFARLAGVPSVLTNHNGKYHGRPRALAPFFLLIMRVSYLLADAVVYVSIGQRSEYEPRARNPKTVIPCGVDPSVFRPRPADRAAFRAAHGWGDDPVVLFVGRFRAGKRPDILRRAAAARPRWTFAFLGKGPIDPRSWNLPNVSVHGAATPENAAAAYNAADVLALTTSMDSLPLVAMEATACGLPVVASKRAHLAEHFAPGTFVPVDDATNDAQAARAWIGALDAALRPEALSRARKAIREHPTGLTWEKTAASYLSLYASVIALRGRGHA